MKYIVKFDWLNGDQEGRKFEFEADSVEDAFNQCLVEYRQIVKDFTELKISVKPKDCDKIGGDA